MRLAKPVIAVLCALGATVLAEGAVRAAGPGAFGVAPDRLTELRRFLDRGPALYEPHPYVGYVVKNRFPRDPTRPDDWRFDLPDDEGVRIACLGGSTTWTHYPFLLAREVETLTGREARVMNWGVPGWSTAETLVNYFLNVQDYEPDVIVLHHSLNDARARRARGYRSDYGHWRRPWRTAEHGAVLSFLIRHSDLVGLISVKGRRKDRLEDYVPQTRMDRSADAIADLPSGSERGFERNVRTICRDARVQGAGVLLVTMPYNTELARDADGRLALWALVMHQHNQILRDIAAEEGAVLVDLAELVLSSTDAGVAYFNDRVHLTKHGLALKARAIAAALIDAGYADGEL